MPVHPNHKFDLFFNIEEGHKNPVGVVVSCTLYVCEELNLYNAGKFSLHGTLLSASVLSQSAHPSILPLLPFQPMLSFCRQHQHLNQGRCGGSQKVWRLTIWRWGQNIYCISNNSKQSERLCNSQQQSSSSQPRCTKNFAFLHWSSFLDLSSLEVTAHTSTTSKFLLFLLLSFDNGIYQQQSTYRDSLPGG